MNAIRFVVSLIAGCAIYFLGLLMLTGLSVIWHFGTLLVGLGALALGASLLYVSSSSHKHRAWAFFIPAGIASAWLALEFFVSSSYRSPPSAILASPEMTAYYRQLAERAPIVIGFLFLGVVVLAVLAFRSRSRAAHAAKLPAEHG